MNECIFYIHKFVDFLPVLEYSMKNRTEQNRTEQNRTEQNRTEQFDSLRCSVKGYFEIFYPLHSERISHRATTQLNKSQIAQYLSSAYGKEV